MVAVACHLRFEGIAVTVGIEFGLNFIDRLAKNLNLHSTRAEYGDDQPKTQDGGQGIAEQTQQGRN